MARFKLEALAPRRYRIGTNADGTARWQTFTAEDVRMHADKLSRMLAAKVPLPVCFEHRDDNHPKRKLNRDQWATEQARGTAGWLEKVEIDSANKMHVEVEIPDERDAKKAETLRFCSPQIEGDVFDGDGTDWGRAFSHLALTPKPIHQHQTPIQRLSGDGARVGATVSDVIRLSVDPEKGTDMADDNKDGKGGKGKDGEGDASGDLKALFDALREAGLVIPDEVTTIPECIIAVKASGGKKAVEDEEFDDDVDAVPPPGGGPGPISMSLQKQQEQAGNLARGNLKARAQRLLKRKKITPAIHKELAAEVETVKLSFTDQGELKPNRLVTRIEAYEALDDNAGWSETQTDTTRMSKVRPAARPKHAQETEGPDESPDARKKRQDDWAAMS